MGQTDRQTDSQTPLHSVVRWVGSGRVESDRVGSDRVESDRVGSDRIESGRVGLGRDRSGRVGSDRIGSGLVGLVRFGSVRVGSSKKTGPVRRRSNRGFTMPAMSAGALDPGSAEPKVADRISRSSTEISRHHVELPLENYIRNNDRCYTAIPCHSECIAEQLMHPPPPPPTPQENYLSLEPLR